MNRGSLVQGILGDVDLTTWVPPAGALEHVLVRDFKRALGVQSLDITDAAIRRPLIQRWSVGGWMERPYGADHEIVDLRSTQHRASAQIRSRCLNVLWEAEQADTQAPLMDATTDMANHALAILWTEDINIRQLHQDFADMMQRAYECTVLARSDRLGNDHAIPERLRAGVTLLNQIHANGQVSDPSVLAALLLRREGRHAMMQPGPDGVRLVWTWLDWLMKDEKPLLPEAKGWLRTPARQVLDHVNSSMHKPDREAWLTRLPQVLDTVLDAPLPRLLSRWGEGCHASDPRRDTVQHIVDLFNLRCQAQARLAQASEAPARSRYRRRS